MYVCHHVQTNRSTTVKKKILPDRCWNPLKSDTIQLTSALLTSNAYIILMINTVFIDNMSCTDAAEKPTAIKTTVSLKEIAILFMCDQPYLNKIKIEGDRLK